MTKIDNIILKKGGGEENVSALKISWINRYDDSNTRVLPEKVTTI